MCGSFVNKVSHNDTTHSLVWSILIGHVLDEIIFILFLSEPSGSLY